MRLSGQALPSPPGETQPRPLPKPRLAPLPEAQWTDLHRSRVAKFSRDGHVGNDFRTLLHMPDLVDALVPYTSYLSSESTLTPRERELLILRTAWLCGNQYLWSSHAGPAATTGLTANEIRRIAEGPDARGWNPFEATLLRLADELYRNSSVTGTTWKALATGYKDDAARLIDAVETVSHFTVLSMMYNSFGVQPDEGTMARLPTDVPYRVVVPPREPPLKAARINPPEGSRGSVFARNPKLNEHRAPRLNYILRVSPLQPRERELLVLRMGWNCQAEFEWAHHVDTVRKLGLDLDPVRIANGPAAPGWDPFDITLLRTSDELYSDGMVSDRTWSALTQRFDTRLLMSALLAASSYRASSVSVNTFGLQLEAGLERFPPLSRR